MNKPIEITRRFQGFYRLQVRRPDGSVREETPWFQNLITDNGLDLIGVSPAGTFGIKYFCPGCFVGSGNTAPAYTDSTLVTQVASKSDGASNSPFNPVTFVDVAGSDPAYFKSVGYWRFSTGAAAGILAEVGVGYGSSNLFSRALILDGGGSPTTVTVLADEVLDVYYELRSYIDLTVVPFTIDISGTNYDGIVKPYDIDGGTPSFSYSVTAGGGRGGATLTSRDAAIPATSYVSASGGGGSAIGGSAIASYVSGNYYLDFRFTWAQGSSNWASGIRTLISSSDQPFSTIVIGFTPTAVPKMNYQVFSLDVRYSWARY